MQSLKYLLTFMLILSAQNVLAETYHCVGMDATGKQLNVIYDEDTSTINVNGLILKVEAATNAKNGVATEDYELESGVKAYVSLVVEGKDKIVLRQMQASDDAELAKADLACT